MIPSLNQNLHDQTIVSFMNSFTDGCSGGDLAFMEVAKKFNGKNHFLVTSELGKKLCVNTGVPAVFQITTFEPTFSRVILTYIKRIIIGSFTILRIPLPDTIYVSSDVLPDVIPALILKFRCFVRGKRPFYVQKFYHINPKERSVSYIAQKLSLSLVKIFADRIITCSEISRQALLKKGFDANSFFVNYLGVDTNIIKDAKPHQKHYSATFLGRLHQSKGIFDLIQVWQCVVEKFPDATLAIIGKGDEELTKRLKVEIRQRGLEKHIDLLGYLGGAEHYRVMKSSKLFLFPSHEEGFGIVLIEAMACGAAVVAYDLPVYREAFGGALCTAKCFDIDEMAKLTIKILENEQERQALLKKARAMVENFSLTSYAERELKLITGRSLR